MGDDDTVILVGALASRFALRLVEPSSGVERDADAHFSSMHASRCLLLAADWKARAGKRVVRKLKI